MSSAQDVYSDWDAAYVMGALSPEDRREFEQHLGACASCSRAVAELAGLPGLLAAVPTEQALLLGEADAGVEPGQPDVPRLADASLRRLLKAARRERNRSRGLLAGMVVAVAAAAATVALVVPGWIGSPAETPATSIAMQQVVPSPLTADIRLAGEAWGTRIESSCRYAKTRYGADAQAYAMYVTDKKGSANLVATWQAGPGTTVEPVGTTSVPLADIATVDIRSVATGQVLLETGPTPAPAG